MTNSELNNWLYENVMDGDPGYWPPTYAESISNAFRVVDKMVEDENSDFYEWQFELGNNHIKAAWYAVFNLPGTDKEYYGFAETRSLAICLAAKKAIEGAG